MGEILAQVLVAMLVTVGVLSIMGWLRQRLLDFRQITVAVWVTTAEDVENLDILVAEAARRECRRASVPVVVLVDHDLLCLDAEGEERLLSHLQQLTDAYGAVWCAVEIEP